MAQATTTDKASDARHEEARLARDKFLCLSTRRRTRLDFDGQVSYYVLSPDIATRTLYVATGRPVTRTLGGSRPDVAHGLLYAVAD